MSSPFRVTIEKILEIKFLASAQKAAFSVSLRSEGLPVQITFRFNETTIRAILPVLLASIVMSPTVLERYDVYFLFRKENIYYKLLQTCE